MKICIPFRPGDIGGTSIFMRKFVKGLEGRGTEVTTDINDDYDLILVIVDYGKSYDKTVREKKRNGVKVVQRLDGVMTFATSKFLYPLQNLRMKYVLHNAADYVLYQSNYCKFLCDKYLGKPKCPWSVVYNGVNTQQFEPEGERYEHGHKHVIFSVARFRRKFQLEPMLRAADYLAADIEDTEFVFAGSLTLELEEIWNKYKERPYIRYLGKVENSKLPFYERGADVFLFSTLNALCPNALIEALGCGLPVAGYTTGSMAELVGDAGILARHNKSDLWRFSNPDPVSLAQAASELLKGNAAWREKARKRAVELFSLDRMVDEYIKVFRKVLEETTGKTNEYSKRTIKSI